jgi:MFS family permease
VLPEQVKSLHPADKAVLLSVVMAAGAIASLIALYLLYFLTDAVHYHDPQIGLMALYAVALAIAGGVCGTASDRSGRRKPFVVAAAIACGAATAILVISPTWPAALVAAPLLGAGFGVRVAADGLRHLLAEVVHGRQHRGVDQRLGRAVVVADRGEVGARGRDDVAGGGVRVALLP